MDQLKPIDSFHHTHKVLTYLGHLKLKNYQDPKTIWEKLHNYYRYFFIAWSVVYLLQEFIFIWLAYKRKDTDKLIEGLLIVFPAVNVVMKTSVVSWNYKRIEGLHDVINDPLFAVKSEGDRKILRGHCVILTRLSKLMCYIMSSVCVIWTIYHFTNRAIDPTYVPTFYVPMNTDYMKGFVLAVFCANAPMAYIGVGHIMLDVLMFCYYYHSVIQIQIIKLNLENLTVSEKQPGCYGPRNNRVYRFSDELDETINERFQNLVIRYAKVLWYNKEVNKIFNASISFQMLTTSFMLCLDIHLLSKGFTDISNTIFYAQYFFLVQAQEFMYCLCGELINYESETIGDAVYQSEWYNLSPRFRRQLLIGMTRWTTGLISKISHLVPLCLRTYFAIMRAAFNLLAVLKATNSSVELFN